MILGPSINRLIIREMWLARLSFLDFAHIYLNTSKFIFWLGTNVNVKMNNKPY